ncbi:hypothetical protein E1286_00465 [Nonomuraea terrae]|uniref:Mycothiol-dependent maleylpyruvate isomerase metal-binding domain-containing protein n=1 Tax=Nonomuraea terrae TaxID=2530383 RepID=A0A4R4ZFA6_9ACTN|nr:hypothetical protein [Nonomuraea terrae]TDD57231.1 hypothetical protein E1286_00465 [Nonomuraea terrae]
MDWTVARTVAHISECLLWYSADLVAGDRELSTMDMRVRTESDPAGLITTLGSFAAVLASVVDGSPSGARGWHPHGLADAWHCAPLAEWDGVVPA